jgi:pimeloyl-ACP methyl ester carboxylesterase
MKLYPGVAVAAAIPTVGAIVAKRALGAKLTQVNASHNPTLDALLNPPDNLHHSVLNTSDGAAIHYVDTNPGADPTTPTVVLCHGITAQWYCWSPVIRGLTDSHDSIRVIAWDMRGHGRSTAGTDGVTIAAAARDIAELLVDLGLTRAVIAGHSMGGMELARFMVDHTAVAQARVQGALFLATSANANTGTRRTGGWARNTGTLNRVSALAGDKQITLKHNNSVAVALMAAGYGPGVTRAMVDLQMKMQNEMSPRSAREGSASIALHNVEPALRQRAEDLSSIEVVVMSGTFDRLTPPIHGRGIVAALPHASWEEVKTSGHNILTEQPHVVVDTLRKLLI